MGSIRGLHDRARRYRVDSFDARGVAVAAVDGFYLLCDLSGRREAVIANYTMALDALAGKMRDANEAVTLLVDSGELWRLGRTIRGRTAYERRYARTRLRMRKRRRHPGKRAGR